ncbi:Disease resistance protein RPP8 [Sesamum angolense]|uniref:Disease resistance protein RPP8 n=1 Tax=Sesamum angolense TaxID=2727404 RepID=A0AAE1X631_9LAMI|nr:Disease resistance protein RPP8 [Sesamum angolense]
MKLRQLLSILEIADFRQDADDGIRRWIAETREAAYNIDDLLLVAVSSRKEGSILKKYVVSKGGTNLNNLERKIKVIEEKISTLVSDSRIRNIEQRQRDIQSRASLTRSYSHYVEDDFVGLDKEVQELVARLVKEDDVQRRFHAFAWVCVSQQWQQEDVIREILNKLEPERAREINRMTAPELDMELVEVQKWKRCLIMLDDVWKTDVWDKLRFPFPVRQVKSKVMITTRNREVARYIECTGTTCYLYEQRHLNEEESWDLLKKKVYHVLNITGEHDISSTFEEDDTASSTDGYRSCLSDEEEDEAVDQLQTLSPDGSIQDQRNQMDMEKLAKEMVAQCGGLPLAVIALGELLMTKSTISEWRMVHQNLNSYLRRGASFRENGRVHEALSLSYADLPDHLKLCFLHIGSFAEDSKVSTRKLYQLWAAEGFKSQESYQVEEKKSIMDMAEHYLSELVQRCMVQVHVDEATGRFKSCRLDDLTRDFCIVKGKEENFVKKVPSWYEPPELVGSLSTSSMATSISTTRRVSIAVDNDFDSYFPPRKENLEHIRSAMFFAKASNRRNLQTAFDFLCAEFKLLRVLDVERFDFGEKLPESVGNLVHLRYLSLRGSQFEKLPASIGNLKYLQTLDLRAPLRVCVTVPNVLSKLNHLKYLYLPPSHKSTGKLQLSSTSELEILKNFDTKVSDYRDISKLTKLQKLAVIISPATENLAALVNFLKTGQNHIRDYSFRVHYNFQSEREFTVLRQLLSLANLRKLDLGGPINRLPEHGHFAESLTKLTLRSSGLKQDPMPTLEKLPNLYSLRLRNAFEGNKICCSSRGFPRLRILEILGLNSLEDWTIEEGAMPNLYALKIDECSKLKMVPGGIKHIAALRELVIANMPVDFKNRIRTGQDGWGEDFHKVEHIPLIRIPETGRPNEKRLEKQQSGRFWSGLLVNIGPSAPKEW